MATCIASIPDENRHIDSTVIHNAALKRVSFDEQQVKTFVYEKESLDGSFQQHSHVKQPFTSPNAPLSRVMVIEERPEVPITILPSAEIDGTGSAPVSPPLPALMKRMEGEVGNPFRPQDKLFHEVDPIVEAYKEKPYPPSLPGSPTAAPVNSHQNFVNGLSPSSLMDDKSFEMMVSEMTPLTDGAVRNGPRGNESNFPKANRIEIVKIQKRKCGCCSVQ